MKNIILFLCLVLGACESKVINKNEAFGSWQLVRTTGGIAGINETPEQSTILILTKDLKYELLINGSKRLSGDFTITEENAMTQGKAAKFIVFSSGIKQMYEVKRNTLYLIDDVYDGFTYEYVRK